ncbi:MAG: right-handed parallel beta-helix repeat-containing protein [Geminicoccaceae bacterium]
MALLQVTTAADKVSSGDGKLSLREAVAQANATAGADTIVFAAGLEGKELVLSRGELRLSRDTTIDGDRDDDGSQVILNGGGDSRLFHVVGAATDVSLTDLRLEHGLATDENGGGILANCRSVTVTDCHFDHCSLDGSGEKYYAGGAIFSTGSTRLTISDSEFLNCIAAAERSDGGAIATDYGTTLSISRTLFSGNYVSYGGGGAIEDHGLSTTIHDSLFLDNAGGGGSAISKSSGNISITDSRFEGNNGFGLSTIQIADSTAEISNCVIAGNSGGGIANIGGRLMLQSSTIADNKDYGSGLLLYAGIPHTGLAVVRNSTITGNYEGIRVASGVLDIGNSIVVGNSHYAAVSDVIGSISISNGRNVFGGDASGAIVGDIQGAAPAAIFAAIDPTTGGGRFDPALGIVPLRNSVANPALGGGDILAALPVDQTGTARPLPDGGLSDIGAQEILQHQSTSPSDFNDLLVGTTTRDQMSGKGGSDLVRGLGGSDVLRGEGGNDLLIGGRGNDLLDGGDGIDLVLYEGEQKVSIDLGAGIARRGAETDRLTSIQGAVGTDADDTFKGDAGPNWFQGGLGQDTAAGGAGRDLYDFDRVRESLPGSARRDRIEDFATGSDRIDLTGIDADAAVAGDQSFRWAGTAALSGPGEVGFFTTGGNTIIRASNDADAAAELVIQLTGIKTLSAADFHL